MRYMCIYYDDVLAISCCNEKNEREEVKVEVQMDKGSHSIRFTVQCTHTVCLLNSFINCDIKMSRYLKTFRNLCEFTEKKKNVVTKPMRVMVECAKINVTLNSDR